MPLKSANINQIASELSDDLIPILTEELRSMGRASHWPVDLIEALTVDVDDNYGISVDYPDELAEKIEDEEYGAPGKIPNAVIRPFILRAPKTVTKYLSNAVVNDIFPALGII